MLITDKPRSPQPWAFRLILLAIFLCLAGAPFLFEGTRALDTSARICIFILLVASYDLLLGYTGVVSFAHTMFFGMGAYGVALASLHMGRSFEALAIGSAAGVGVAIVLAAIIGLFSLRVRAIFFAMITLAVASAMAVLVSQMSGFTGGEDGLTFQIPRELTPAYKYSEEPLTGLRLSNLSEVIQGSLPLEDLFRTVRFNGKLVNYYLIFGGAFLLFLILLRITVSPFGRVLQGIRENEFRAEAVGYSVVSYRIAATCLSAAFAALAGALFAIWLRYVGPDTTLSFDIMIEILLMLVIGGMGTIYGAAIGATLFLLAQSYLQELMAAGQSAVSTLSVPYLPQLLEPDRWLLWLGVLFVLSVYFFPTGIAGRLRRKVT